ncbi:MAG: hypothetical protein LW832_07140 [Parachlamydia sp.]|jgi:uncharacterized coiled-coil DUF342 family protein|nr:hypothetical protein [Parachlamydia sp.]
MVIKELHNKIEENQKKMAEMMINLDILKEEYQNLMKELGLTAEELKSFAKNSENFSPPIWEQLQNEKKEVEEKLDLALNNIPDPLKVRKTMDQKSAIQNHWLFVR